MAVNAAAKMVEQWVCERVAVTAVARVEMSAAQLVVWLAV